MGGLTVLRAGNHGQPNNIFEHRNMQWCVELAADRTPFVPANVGSEDLQTRDPDPQRLVRAAIGQPGNPKALLGNIFQPDHCPWARRGLPHFAKQRYFGST